MTLVSRLKTVVSPASGNRRGKTRNALVVVVSGVLAAASLGAVPAHPAVASPLLARPMLPRSISMQHLHWTTCYPGAGYPRLKCARVVTPLDWAHPRGPRIAITVSRIKASDPAHRHGVLFTNPGGPGGAGLALPLFIPETDPRVAAAFDLIGIDQRGVGSAAPTLRCSGRSLLTRLYNLDGRDTSRDNQAKIKRLDKRFARRCSSAPLTRYIQHSQTVQDFDLVRRLLHERTINYLGFSAGTQLGAWYAATFPDHVGRFVFDGNLDWTSLTYQSFARQPRGFQISFEHYLEPWMAGHNAVYHLGHTVRAVDATYEHRRDRLTRHPVTLTDGTTLTAAGYDSGITSALYVTASYPQLSAAMSILERYPSATRKEKKLVTQVFSSSAEGQDPFWSIVCQDDRSPSYAHVVRDANDFRRRYPLVGANWNVDVCPFFTLPTTGSPVRGENLPGLLMLNNDEDPATPLHNAQVARAHTPAARLVTVRNEAQHTIYGYGDACADGYANRWLLRGVLPQHDVSCPGLPLPSAQSVARAVAPPAAAASRTAVPMRLPVELWLRRFTVQHGQPDVR